MNASNDLHRRSMDVSALALMDRMRGNPDNALGLFRQALELELAAIAELKEPIEPTFSVLHRSAATLALDSNQPRQAEKLVAYALAHEPPPEIADELRDLLDQINCQRHLELRGVVLQEEEIQLSFSGADVGFGIASATEVQNRITDSSRLIYRIAERQSRRPFRDRGGTTNLIKKRFEPFLSLPRAASYSVTLRFGRPTDQLSFPGMLGTLDVLNEFMDLMGLVNNNTISEIRNRIPEPPYLRNFLGLAKMIAPDGERIRQVGFTTITSEGKRFVSVTRPASELPPPAAIELPVPEAELVEVRGVLRYADAIRNNQIKVVDSRRKSHNVEVPEGMMADIVRPLWDSPIVVKGLRKGNLITLPDIQKDDE